MFARSHHRLSKKRRLVACRQYRRTLDGRKSIRMEWNLGHISVEILTANGTLLGETGLIRPGEYVKSVSLTSEVEDGTAIKLKIMAYEPDTYYSAGSVTLNTILREEGAE